MSACNFFKHLPCSYYRTFFSRRFFRPREFCSSASPSSFSTSSSSASPSSFSSSSSSASPSSFSTSSSCGHPSTAPYLSVRIYCPKHVLDPFSEALLCFGANSVSVDEEDDISVSGSSAASDEICIDSIFPVHEEVKLCISQAANSVGLKKVPSFQVEKGEEHDWIQKTQESFEPVEVTEGLWIVPEWTSPPVAEAMNIMLNPGLAFGTGDHPTTKLCLLLLRSLIEGGETFLDYGTGSGILAIAAIKFGATSSVGIDIDPVAITSAHHNAELNNIQPEKLQLYIVPSDDLHGQMKRQEFDLVVANILLNPLLELADNIVSYVKPRGTIAVSGILSEQLPEIIELYSQFLEDISVSEIDGWACLRGTKKAKAIDSQDKGM